MTRLVTGLAIITAVSGLVQPISAAEQQPIVYSVRVEKFGFGTSDAGAFADWDATFRIGNDDHRFVLRTEGERVKSKFEEAELTALYERPLWEFWNVQAGWRRDFKPRNRNHLAFGFQGLSPNFFEVETTGYLSEKGALGGRFKGSIDLLIARDLFGTGGIGLFAEPWVEVNVSSKADREMGVGSGIVNVKPALQIRYEFERWFAPYVEVGWERKLGQTARFARDERERESNIHWVVGIRSWF
ncbi:MAG: copper resistance protein B [Alphaproteobacteria bacterium]|nr:copper resistance protein B [Alphaproteobacteria bacterium]